MNTSSQSEFFWSLRDLIKLVTIMSKSMSQSEFRWSLRDHYPNRDQELRGFRLNPSFVGV